MPEQLKPQQGPLLTLAPLLVALASSAVTVLGLGGCASSAGIQSAAQPVAAASVGLDDGSTLAPVPADWWRGFNDPRLNELVTRALADSPNLKVAQARLARTQAMTDSARAAEGLQLNGQADVTRQRFSATSIYPPPLGGGIYTLGTAQIGASWEFDFFGRNRAAIEAAVGLGRAAQAEHQAARILLASNVVRAYVQLGRLFEQRAVAARALQQRDELLGLVRQRVQVGLDTSVELRQGEGALPEARQQIEQIDEQIAWTRNTLAALTAQPPAALDGLKATLPEVQGTVVPSTLPADLLGRRADITAARWRIEAATSDVANAKAQFYPNINLSAFIGLSSIGLDRFINAGSEQYGGGPALRLPIFDSGRLRAGLRARTADLDAAVESYNGAVIDAVHDAADQVASLRAIDRQKAEQQQAQASAESAYELSMQRYRAGLSTYLTVLYAESALLNQRRLAADLKARSLDTQIGLIRAMGGGYAPEKTL